MYENLKRQWYFLFLYFPVKKQLQIEVDRIYPPNPNCNLVLRIQNLSSDQELLKCQVTLMLSVSQY